MATNAPHRTSSTLLSASDAFVESMGLENRPVVNGTVGGMWGWAGNIFEYVSAHPHMQQQSWCVLLSTPAFFSKLPAGNQLHSLCKAFFENRTQTFEGLYEQTEVNFGEIKWAGGHTLSIPAGSTRSLGVPSHQVIDAEGEVFTKMIKTWVHWGLMDPQIQSAKLVTLADPGDMLIDDIAASAIYFEPTRNLKDIAHAQLAVGIQPKNTVRIELRRNKEDEGKIRVINQEFVAAIESDTLAVKEIARAMLRQMSFYNPDAIAAPAGFKSKTSILTSLTDSGTIERMKSQSAQVADANYIG